MNEVVETLVAARALIADEANWIKGDYSNGGAFCAYGAIDEVVDDDQWESRKPYVALNRALPDADWPTAVIFNDHPATSHADVLALFDRAIEAARADA